MVPGDIHCIREAGINRRWHSRDVSRHGEGHPRQHEAPNVHNSLAIQQKHVANMYRNWKSLNSHAHGPANTDGYARHIPIGRVCSERTSSAPLTESDRGNMYAGSFVFAPGPNTYDVNLAWRSRCSTRKGPTMGSAPRKCMATEEMHPQLPHSKRRDGVGPGPGAYATSDVAVMGNRGSTFAAADERKGSGAALEIAVTRLKTLEWRIAVIRQGTRDPESISPGQALVVKTQSGYELVRMEAKASRLRRDVQLLAAQCAAEAARRDLLPGPCFGDPVVTRHGNRRTRQPAKTTGRKGAGNCRVFVQPTDRFYDPITSTASFLDTPGPGSYDLARSTSAFRPDVMSSRGPSFDLMECRVVGERAAQNRSLASVRLHSSGATEDGDTLTSFHSYMCEAGPGEYTPDMGAPLLPGQGRARRTDARL